MGITVLEQGVCYMSEINLSEEKLEKHISSIILAFQALILSEDVIKVKDENIIELLGQYLSGYEKYSDLVSRIITDNIFFTTDNIVKMREQLNEKIKDLMSAGDFEKNIERIGNCISKIEAYDYDKFFNAGIYNLILLLFQIDNNTKLDQDLLYAISLNDYKEADSIILKMMDGLGWMHLGVSDYIIKLNQEKEQFNWDKHYNVAVNSPFILKPHRSFSAYKSLLINEEPNCLDKGDCFLSDILLMIDLYRVKQQCILEKFIMCILFVVLSPEYSDQEKEYAFSLIGLLNEILYCGEIHKIYFQEGIFDLESSLEKTSKEATTRISLIFSVDNDDIYILRIDLPHKGEEFFHLNLHEIRGDRVVDTAYPVTYEEINKFDKRIIDKLFFEMNGLYWFRIEPEEKIKQIKEGISKEEFDEIKDLFHSKAHEKIEGNDIEHDVSKIALSVMEEIKKFSLQLTIDKSKYLSFNKDDIDYVSEVKKIRKLFYLENIVYKLFKEHGDVRVKSEEIIKLFDKELETVQENKPKIESIIELWDYIKIIFD